MIGILPPRSPLPFFDGGLGVWESGSGRAWRNGRGKRKGKGRQGKGGKERDGKGKFVRIDY